MRIHDIEVVDRRPEDIKQKRDHIWAHCPHCPEKAHAAGFPLTINTTYEIDWVNLKVDIHGSVDVLPLKQHMEQLHADKLAV